MISKFKRFNYWSTMEIETEPQTMEPIDYNNPQMWSGNRSGHGNLIEDITMDTNFAMLLCSLIFAIAWVIYITYYNSRLVGYIITKIVNKLFIRDGYFKIGL